ncbi:MAG: NADH-quinone oxidoreductase subunit J [Bacteroidia bacterium]|nr:NADH-quinone oxidoreductase subunit J [Bacteroidia bacterium]
MLETLIAFYAFLGIMAVGLVWMLLTKKLIQAAFLLFTVLLGVAAMYVFLGAEFLAVAQLIVYVGGILVIIMFGIMLTQREGSPEAESPVENLLPSIMLGGTIFLGLIYLWRGFHNNLPGWIENSDKTGELPPNVEQIGALNLSTYLLPFEFMSVLLLLALVGAAFLARRASRKSPTT